MAAALATPHCVDAAGHRVAADRRLAGRPAFDEGRSSDQGILHATMAVRHDWGGNSPLHLGMFFAVRLASALKAYHGEGDHAPDASQTQVQKAVYIVDTIVNVWVT